MPPFFFARRMRPWRTFPSAPMLLQNSVITCVAQQLGRRISWSEPRGLKVVLRRSLCFTSRRSVWAHAMPQKCPAAALPRAVPRLAWLATHAECFCKARAPVWRAKREQATALLAVEPGEPRRT